MCRLIFMAPHALQSFLDMAVPWVAFTYGCFMIFAHWFVTSQPALVKLAETRIPEPHRTRFFAHLPLAWVCLFVGGVWILQDLWLAS